jgi:hypothetical protein
MSWRRSSPLLRWRSLALAFRPRRSMISPRPSARCWSNGNSQGSGMCRLMTRRMTSGASTRAEAEAAIDVFAEKYAARYEQAVACLTKDRDALVAFFDFPAEH